MQCLVSISIVEEWCTYLIKIDDSEQSRYRDGDRSFGQSTGLGKYETFQQPTSFQSPFILPVSYSSDGRGWYLLTIPHSPTPHQPTLTQHNHFFTFTTNQLHISASPHGSIRRNNIDHHLHSQVQQPVYQHKQHPRLGLTLSPTTVVLISLILPSQSHHTTTLFPFASPAPSPRPAPPLSILTRFSRSPSYPGSVNVLV